MHPRFATMDEVIAHLGSKPYASRNGGAYYQDGKVFEVCTHCEPATVWDHSNPLPQNRGRVWAEEWIRSHDDKPSFPSSLRVEAEVESMRLYTEHDDRYRFMAGALAGAWTYLPREVVFATPD